MKVVCVAHSDFALGDHILSWMEDKHYTFAYCRPFQGDLLPQVNEFDWLILTGGMYCLLEKNKYPFLLDEIRFVEEAITHNKIVLGFCLGAQIIGESYQQKTEPSPHREIGVFPVELTPEGMNDPLLTGLPASFNVSHWHQYMPGITETAKILATSQGCPRQIIRYSSKVYGFQCHPEATFQNTQKAISLFEKELTPGPYVQSKEQFLQSDFSAMKNIILSILNNITTLTVKNLQRF